MPLPQSREKYTVHDYMTWPDEERWEIIGGVAYDMSPAPNILHQTISMNLSVMIGAALHGKTCRVFAAPTDVILSEHDVVQPDVFVVCDPDKITEKNIQGAPDLVIEILSPHTSTKDQREKRRLYEKSGVLEYAIVDPGAKHIQRFLLDDNQQFDRGEIFDARQTVSLKSLQNLEVPLWEVFGIERKAGEGAGAQEQIY
ncbi:MAG: Uma2 family endonuclease [Candidatus Hinthialibacter sp.]